MRASGNSGGAARHANCMCPGGGGGRRAGSGELSDEYDGQFVSEGEGDGSRLGGIGARGGEGSRTRGGAGRRASSGELSGEYDGQLVSAGEDDGSCLGGVGARGGEGSRTRGGLAGARLGSLNPRPLRETRTSNSAGTDLPGSASSPGRRRLSSWRRSRRPAPDQQGWQGLERWGFVVVAHIALKHSNFLFELQLARAGAQNA